MSYLMYFGLSFRFFFLQKHLVKSERETNSRNQV